jgi:hypothetical protein
MLHARGFRIPGFRIPNLVWGMGRCGVRGIARHERHMSHRTRRVSPGRTLGVLGGRNLGARVGALGDRVGRKEGDRVDTGSGQRKAPRGNLGGEGEIGRLSTVACEGAKGHQGDEEGRKEEVSQGAE